ncbi:MAG: hypothetical protein MZV70_60385 [Desulfobacterales bacterium]|nr:hypothetical protein [Desulfobacterales bacterium]
MCASGWSSCPTAKRSLSTRDLQLALRRVRGGHHPDGHPGGRGGSGSNGPRPGPFSTPRSSAALLNLGFSADHDVFSGQLYIPEARYTSPQATATASQAEVHWALALGPDRITLEDGRLRCRSLTLKREGMEELSLHAPRLSAAGEFERRQGVLKLARWQLTVDKLLDSER